MSALLSQKLVAEILGVNVRTVARLSERLQVVRIEGSRRVYYAAEVVERFARTYRPPATGRRKKGSDLRGLRRFLARMRPETEER